MPDAISPGAIPGKDIHPDLIEAHARTVASVAASVRDNGSAVHTKWQGLSGYYSAPESGTLLGLMQPVSTQATTAGDNLDAVAAALTQFAADVRPIKAELESLKLQAETFVNTTVNGGVQVREVNPAWISSRSYSGSWNAYGSAPSSYGSYGSTSTSSADVPQYRYVQREWHEVQSAVDRNNELISAVNAQQVALWEAERVCANKIRSLYGAAALRSFQSEDDSLGYGLDEIPEGTDMPWGAPVERSEGCGEATFNFVVKDFLWEGIIVGGIWGTVQGLGTLTLGYNPETGDWFSGDAYGAAWGNLGLLLAAGAMNSPALGPVMWVDQGMEAFGGGGFLPDEVRDFKARADEAALNTGKALIAWDKWQDDPGTALGESVFNVGTILIPGGAAVAGVKTAGTAASVLAKTARVVDLIDPGAWAVNGATRLGSLGLGSLDNLIGKMDFSPNLDAPNVDVYTAMDSSSAINMLDDWGVDLDSVSARLDDGVPVLEFPGGRIELPEGSFDGVRVGDGGADATAQVPVREPELVGVGGRGETSTGVVNSIVDEAPVRTETGGSGESTVVREPSTETGASGSGTSGSGDSGSGGGSGSDGGGSDGGGGSGSDGAGGGDRPVDSSRGDDGGMAAGNDIDAPSSADEFLIRADGPMYSDADAGPGWTRADDTGTADDHYGEPRTDSGRPQPWYTAQDADNPAVIALVEDPSAPFGRDLDGTPIRDQADWDSRYSYPDATDGSAGGVRWPTNDGAVEGTRVHYDTTDALLHDYPEFSRLDRIGLWGGDYLTVEGTPFEARGLTPGHRAMDYTAFDLTPPLPNGVKIEVSVIDRALGYPGGGWQIRFFRTGAENTPVYLSVDELIDLEVLG